MKVRIDGYILTAHTEDKPYLKPDIYRGWYTLEKDNGDKSADLMKGDISIFKQAKFSRKDGTFCSLEEAIKDLKP